MDRREAGAAVGVAEKDEPRVNPIAPRFFERCIPRAMPTAT